MLGYNTMKEVLVWIQTEKPQHIKMKYWTGGKVQISYTQSREASGLTAKLIAKNLEPRTTYEYDIFLDSSSTSSAHGTFSTQALWQHRTNPPDFDVAIGSCVYSNEAEYDRPGEPYGSGYEIFQAICKKNPQLMLWLGDNVYLREPDWSSRSGIFHRYTHFKSMPEIQELWKSMHHYAIWDDHDFGPNNADRSFVGKETTLEAFQLFWGNPEYGIKGQPGITTQFSFNDVDFFLLDNRYYRTSNDRKTGERFILGKEQVQWLVDALVFSQASFKIVAIGGPFLNSEKIYENHANYSKERKQLISLIRKEKIKNVIFLSGDMHKTELSKMNLGRGNYLYDYTCSPLTSAPRSTAKENNKLRVEGTYVDVRNFGTLSFKGSFENRKLVLKNFNNKGELIWTHEILKH